MLMPLRRAGVVAPAGLCRLAAACLIMGSAAAHLAYLARDCPLDLAPDEAHYWDWSRHPDWSYYSKGPLVAYLIRGGCLVAGAWSEQVTGNLALAVRLPAVLCGSLLLASLYVLTLQIYGRERLALGVVALALTLPPVAVGSSLMTIDSPYTCCWGWALVLVWHAVFRASRWAWVGAGCAVGLGILAKYTMVLFLPSVALFLLTTPGYRRLLRRPGFWVMTGITGLCCLPILVWNVQHGWVSYRHVVSLSGIKGEGPRLHWLGPLVYVGGQCGLLLVYWFVAWAGAMLAHQPLAERDPGRRYLWWLSAPTFGLFLAFSFKTGGGEVNWPVTAYLSGLVLAAGWLTVPFQSPRGWYRRLNFAGLVLACGAGLLLTVFLHRSDYLHPLMSRVTGPPSPANRFPLRRFDPTCRLKGWRDTLAVEVDRVVDELRAGGEEPVLAATSWTVPGELGFYCRGHPQAYSVGLLVGDRHSQYDLWPNPLDDGAALRGRTFVLVGYVEDVIKAAFDRVEPTRMVVHSENGQPISAWFITVCRGFRGFAKPKDTEHPETY